MELSIIIPARNEADRIIPTFESYLDVFRRECGEDFELIVVVNDSSDDTEAVTAAYCAKAPEMVMETLHERVGKGGAILHGLSLARGRFVGFTDADGATPAESFLQLVRELETADVAIGSRWLPESRVTTPQHWKRRLFSRCFNLLVRGLFILPIADTQCGAKVARRELLERIQPFLRERFWILDLDLLVHARMAGGRIRELPITWTDQPGSKLDTGIRSAIGLFGSVLRLRWRTWWERPDFGESSLDKNVGKD